MHWSINRWIHGKYLQTDEGTKVTHNQQNDTENISITIFAVLVILYNDVIMDVMVSHITSLTIVYSAVYSGADQRKHQSSASLQAMDLLWEKFLWILPLYMKPICFQSKASVVCSVTAAIYIGQKANEYLNSAEQIHRKWNVDQPSALITTWDIT